MTSQPPQRGPGGRHTITAELSDADQYPGMGHVRVPPGHKAPGDTAEHGLHVSPAPWAHDLAAGSLALVHTPESASGNDSLAVHASAYDKAEERTGSYRACAHVIAGPVGSVPMTAWPAAQSNGRPGHHGGHDTAGAIVNAPSCTACNVSSLSAPGSEEAREAN
jgi:hypothetical protein